MKKTMFFATLVFLLFSLEANAQNGRILEKKPYSIPDTSLLKIEKRIPQARAILANVDLFRITYLSDGLKVKGYMSMPKKSGKYPCILFNRGGNREFGKLGDMSLVRFLAEMSNWGYVVVASQYRGNDGGEGKEEFGGKDVHDILNLIPMLSNVEMADTSRIGMFGWSRGGMMTYLSLTQTSRIKAAVVGSGMADAFLQTRKRPEMKTMFSELIPEYAMNPDSVLKTRSAVYWADKICPTTPLLILAGSSDWRVSHDEAFEMVQKLNDIHHPVRFSFYEGGEHSLMEHVDEVNHDVRLFLDQYVRDRKAMPDMKPHGN